MSSGNFSSPGKGISRRKTAVPKRAGGRFFNETLKDDSSSDSDTPGVFEHSGGAKLNASPYRPPHIRAAKALKSGSMIPTVSKGADGHLIANDGTNVTSESTDVDSPLAVKMGKLTFQRGSPAGLDVFGPATTSSSSERETTARMDATTTKAVRPKSALLGAQARDIRAEADEEPMSPRAINAMIATAMTTGRSAITKAQQDDDSGSESGAVVVRSQPSTRHLVGDQDAQRVYSHTSCVFIANLPQQKSDEGLEAEITRHFSPFGTVFVKIKRDERNMPFGFLQYTNDEDAAAAIQHGAGIQIFGRACRVEMAKANRTFLVFHHDRSYISVGEAMEVVAPYGAVSHVEPLRADFAEILRLPSAVLVEFVEFDCERDIVNRHRGDRTYRVVAFDPTRMFRDPPRTNNDQAYLSQYEKDRRSVFVSDFPKSTTEEQLRETFEAAGDVVHVQIVQRTQNALKPFAFVEFSRPDMPVVAISQFHKKVVFGTVLRVERKNSRDYAPRRVDSTFLRQLNATPGNDGSGTGARSGGSRRRQATPHRSFTAAPGSTPFVNAQADMSTPRTVADQTPAHDNRPAPPIVVSSTQPAAVPSSAAASMPTNRGPAPTTPAGGLTVPNQQFSGLAPPFGPNGYYLPSPVPFPPFGGFAGPYAGFNGHQFPTYGQHHQQHHQQHLGFLNGQMSYYQDPASGLIYPMAPIAAPPMVDQTPAFGQRSASAMPYVPAAEHLHRTSNTSLKSKKSVSFADPVVQGGDGGPSRKEEEDGESSTKEKEGAA